MRSFLEESLVEPCEECGWRRCGSRWPERRATRTEDEG